jgi:hypothetical protein
MLYYINSGIYDNILYSYIVAKFSLLYLNYIQFDFYFNPKTRLMNVENHLFSIFMKNHFKYFFIIQSMFIISIVSKSRYCLFINWILNLIEFKWKNKMELLCGWDLVITNLTYILMFIPLDEGCVSNNCIILLKYTLCIWYVSNGLKKLYVKESHNGIQLRCMLLSVESKYKIELPPLLAEIMSQIALFLEIFLYFFLFIPTTRLFALLIFIGFHIFISLTMKLECFLFPMITLLLSFIKEEDIGLVKCNDYYSTSTDEIILLMTHFSFMFIFSVLPNNSTVRKYLFNKIIWYQNITHSLPYASQFIGNQPFTNFSVFFITDTNNIEFDNNLTIYKYNPVCNLKYKFWGNITHNRNNIIAMRVLNKLEEKYGETKILIKYDYIDINDFSIKQSYFLIEKNNIENINFIKYKTLFNKNNKFN